MRRLSKAEQLGWNSEAIILYDRSWRINPYYLEVSKCKTSVFYNMNSYQQFDEAVDISGLPDNIAFFLIDMDAENFINDFVASNPDYTVILDNGTWTYGHSYYLSR